MWVDREQPCTRTPLTLSSLLCSSCCFSHFSSAFLSHKRLFQHGTSVISKRQSGSLTTTRASLCYHLPRVYQLDTRTGWSVAMVWSAAMVDMLQWLISCNGFGAPQMRNIFGFKAQPQYQAVVARLVDHSWTSLPTSGQLNLYYEHKNGCAILYCDRCFKLGCVACNISQNLVFGWRIKVVMWATSTKTNRYPSYSGMAYLTLTPLPLLR